jgi:cob(I)alamin adenosyltransferase
VKIYTRRGDGGETDLFGGGRVAKDDRRVDALGAVDELNACVGICAATTEHADLRRIAHAVQGRLLDLGGALAAPDPQRRAKSGVGGPTEEDVEELEAHIDALEPELPPLKRFILPGGTPAAAALHAARTVCRRAERRVVALHREAPLDAGWLRYLNRLSDLLFVMARVENHRRGVDDIEWEGRRS